MSRELGLRLAVAGVGIPVCVAVTWAGGVFFVAGVAFLAAVSAREYVLLLRDAEGPGPLYVLTVAAAGVFPVAVAVLGTGEAWQLAAPLLAVAAAWGFMVREPERGPVTAAALTVFGALYLGGLLGFAVPLRGSGESRLAGTLLFFLPVTVTWASDTAAYFGGNRFGRRQLAPAVSPNKTWAGAISALAAGPAVSGAYAALLLPLAGEAYPAMPGGTLALGPALLLGLAVAVAAILGDLAESALKRECGAKDSSGLLPGHGGLLDRLDSLLWAIPVAHLYLQIYGGAA